jgi:DNA invertase Pin-like site-specific DNA recombinase/archaellum component FlaC
MRTALYARVSSDRQDVDLSISAQLRFLREYAARNNHVIVKEFIDQAESGRTAYRPQFREMISLARQTNRPFDLILVYKYSRFARSREDSIVYKALLKKSGIQLISITEPVDDSAMGRLIQAIIECIDEFYSENLGEEVTRGMRESASHGFYLSSRAPYGYRKIKVRDGFKEHTRLETDEFQSRVVASIFDEVVNGKGLMEIVKGLNSRGIGGPKGKGWSKTSISKMLSNEVYAGTIVWGRNSKRGLPPIRMENACPAVVDQYTFEQVQKNLDQRAFAQIHPRRVSSQYLLSGLVRCGHCGKALIGMEAKNGEYSYYVCGTLTKKGAGSCPSRYLNSRKLECLVVDKIKAHVLTTENLTNLAELVTNELNCNSEVYREELGTMDKEITDVIGRLERVYDAIETGKIALDDLAPRIRELRERQERLQARKQELHTLMSEQKAETATKEEVAECAEDLRNALETSSLAERKAFIRSFIKEIRITGDDALMTYALPMLPGEVTEEKVPVLGIVHYGGR